MLGYDDLGSRPLDPSRVIIVAPFVDMVKKTPPCGLASIIPTEEEKAKAVAKRALLDEKGKKSLKASVRNFWKANIDANTGSISEVPDDLIDEWLTHLARSENAEKHVQNNREFNSKSSKMNELRWCGKEILLRDFGAIRGQYWLDTGLLPTRGDRITKKHGEFITEHGVPDDWELLTEEDFRQLRAQVEFELSKENGAEELETFMQAGRVLQTSSSSGAYNPDGRLPGGCASAEAIIKVEGPTAGEVMADKVESLKATKDPCLQMMRTINLEVRTMWAKAQKMQKETGKDNQVTFIQECAVLEKKSIRAIRVLERWAVDGEEPIESQLAKLALLTEESDTLFEEACDRGKKFKFAEMGAGVGASASGGKRRKKGEK